MENRSFNRSHCKMNARKYKKNISIIIVLPLIAQPVGKYFKQTKTLCWLKRPRQKHQKHLQKKSTIRNRKRPSFIHFFIFYDFHNCIVCVRVPRCTTIYRKAVEWNCDFCAAQFYFYYLNAPNVHCSGVYTRATRTLNAMRCDYVYCRFVGHTINEKSSIHSNCALRAASFSNSKQSDYAIVPLLLVFMLSEIVMRCETVMMRSAKAAIEMRHACAA